MTESTSVRSATIGYPRIGADRELKWALESFWDDEIDESELRRRTRELREQRWRKQADAGIDVIPSNDFSLYDHVLDTARMVGAIPERYEQVGGPLAQYFAMARGAPDHDLQALEMTKWFDTNYHYIVPELQPDQTFSYADDKPVRELQEAAQLGIRTRPVLLGPVSFLQLVKMPDADGSPLDLLDGLVDVYAEILADLADAGADAVQIEEPCLALDQPEEAREAYHRAYRRLEEADSATPSLMLTTYFGPLGDNLSLACQLPVDGLHLDLVRGDDLEPALEQLDDDQTLSLGLIDGRNVWRTDLDAMLETVETATEAVGRDRLQVAAACSMLHVPIDADAEEHLDDELRSWLAFADQKLDELSALADAANDGRAAAAEAFDASREALEARSDSIRSHRPAVRERLEKVDEAATERESPFAERNPHQEERLDLPDLPTTTIGSFPQRSEIRQKRSAYRDGDIDRDEYETFIADEIERTIRAQEEIGLDLLVHGESERSDMVEYFAEQLVGFEITTDGWVQSYGSRCVRPPIIYGDVEREAPMTLKWTTHADELTDRPVKGVLTGPTTMVNWSFVRDDQPKSETARQIALAVRDEVADLEEAGIPAIQVDEPALREGLPLREENHDAYLDWAVESFRLATCTVADETQIQTHMCYSDFANIIDSVADLDADVLFIEASRSDMELLDVFAEAEYPNDLGLGVFDIHSPRIPSPSEMVVTIERAVNRLGADKLWVNPDCGLKTRNWEEVEPSLTNMVEAASTKRGAELDPDRELDVRPLVPIQRHETLPQLFEDLSEGESFTFVNDHDPKPLYYEFRSIYGDVVDWEYLDRGSKAWKVKVTRTEETDGRDFSEASTLIDLRETDEADWKHVVFHRYGMMPAGDTMEIVADEEPTELHEIFRARFADEHTWEYDQRGPDEYVVHVEKRADDDLDATGAALVDEFDVRPHPPAKRHDMVFEAFDQLGSSEAFVFINDHDPKPLYYQMEAESDEAFTWEYLDDGPEEWRVRIAKR